MSKRNSSKTDSKLNLIEKLNNRRNPDSKFQRRSPFLLKKQTILIVCEGQNTEPSYFNQFRLVTAKVKSVGLGYNTISLVKKALELSKESNYDQVWCVFDADPKPNNPNQANNFNEAIILAEKNNFGVAYSNQAFEYWIILHLNNHQGGKIPRTDYNRKINQLLKPHNLHYDGKKSKIINEELFDFLMEIDNNHNKQRIDLAIQRAEKIYNNLEHNNPSKEESSTTVFKLVKEILKYL